MRQRLHNLKFARMAKSSGRLFENEPFEASQIYTPQSDNDSDGGVFDG